MPKLIATWGSLRTDSWNKKIVLAAAKAAEAEGASITVVDPRDFPLPVFDEDLEASDGLHDNCLKLKDLFKAHDGLLIGCPEYNSSITAALKNMIDWVTRPRDGEAPLECFKGKVAGLTAASPGSVGGLRGLFHVRAILQNIQTIVTPQMAAVPNVDQVYDDAAGSITDDARRAAVETVGRETARLGARLAD